MEMNRDFASKSFYKIDEITDTKSFEKKVYRMRSTPPQGV